MLAVRPLAIPDVKIVEPRRFGDNRGYFSETFKAAAFEEAGVPGPFVQDNQSHSAAAGTLRGLHMQAPPFAQAKLVRVLRGAVFDVAVDVRTGSPTYGQHVGAVLSADNFAQIYVPAGFLHGFLTLEPDCTVLYKVSAYYDRASEGGVAWDDADLAIDWPLPASGVVLSDKDGTLPRFRDFRSPF